MVRTEIADHDGSPYIAKAAHAALSKLIVVIFQSVSCREVASAKFQFRVLVPKPLSIELLRLVIVANDACAIANFAAVFVKLVGIVRLATIRFESTNA